MIYLYVALGLAGLMIFSFLGPKTKVLVSYLVMMSLFDCVPNVLLGFFVWDAGIILLFFSWMHLWFTKESPYVYRDTHVRLIKVFVWWMIICFAWSVLVYDYPLLLTIKASRQLMLGYMSFFVLLRLFEEKNNGLTYFLNIFYWLTYVLLVICLVQYVLKVEILFGLIKEYQNAVRALPVFLPFSHLFLWFTLSRFLSGQKTMLHEKMYVLLTLVVTLITFTRGIYFSILLSTIFILLIMLAQRKLVFTRISVAVGAFLIGFTLLFFTTAVLDKAIGRFTSAFTLLSEVSRQTKKQADDTFTGRIGLMKERFAAVADKNPITGFGFIHEEIYEKQRMPFRYGSVIYTEEYRKRYATGHPYVLALHSADVGWQNIAIDTGIVGFSVFMLILVSVFLNYFSAPKDLPLDDYFLRLAFFIQIFNLAILMFNGNTYTNNVHIPAFMLAAFTYLTHKSRQNSAPAASNVRLVPQKVAQIC